MNRLPLDKRAHILSLLVEGNSLRSITRIADVSINTVTKLLVDVGTACARYQDEHLRNLPCKKIQVDEIWSFCYAKEKNLPAELKGKEGYGNVWTWTSICADTKLVPCWHVGDREWRSGYKFLRDLHGRLANRIQLSTDGYSAYPMVVEAIFGGNIDFGMLVKHYDEPELGRKRRRVKLTGISQRAVIGHPKLPDISTSLVERQNLTMRMGMRRFTRKTNGHSKKIENHAHAVAIHFFTYNFIKIHGTIRTTPAMAAGVTDRLWEFEDLIKMTDRHHDKQNIK